MYFSKLSGKSADKSISWYSTLAGLSKDTNAQIIDTKIKKFYQCWQQ